MKYFKYTIIGFLLAIATTVTVAQTIPTLDQFTATTSPRTGITQRSFGREIKVTGLTSSSNLCLDANNYLTTTGCSTGSISNWTRFNNSGIRPATSTDQVLVGGTATTSLSKLEVQGSDTVATFTGSDPDYTSLSISNSTNGSTGFAYLSVAGSTGIDIFGLGATPSISVLELDSTSFGAVVNRSNAPLYFGTNNVMRGQISSTGKWGIGNSDTPTYPLDVQSATINTVARVGPNAIIESVVSDQSMFAHNATYSLASGWRYVNTDYASAVRMHHDNGSFGTIDFSIAPFGTAGNSITNWDTTNKIMTINGNGNVGIGTTSPYAKLSVVGQVAASYYTATSSGGTATSTFNGAVAFGSGLKIYGDNYVGFSSYPDNLILSFPTFSGGSPAGFQYRDDGVKEIDFFTGYRAGAAAPFIIYLGADVNNPALTASMSGGIPQVDFTQISQTGLYNVQTTSIPISVRNSSNVPIQTGQISSSWIVPTTGSYTGQLSLFAKDFNGTREGIRITSDGTNPTTVLNPGGGGNVGIATGTPWAKLSVASANATTRFPLFAVSSSSAAVSTSTAFKINWDGEMSIGTTTAGVLKTSSTGVIYSSSPLDVSSGGTGLSTLASTRIPFGNGTSAFGSDSNLTWDSSGTALTVSSAGTAYINIFGANVPQMKVGPDSTHALQFYWYDGAGYFGSVANTAPLHFAGSEVIFDPPGGEALRVTNGKVGVASTSPFAKFSIQTVAGEPNAFNIGSSTQMLFNINTSGRHTIASSSAGILKMASGTIVKTGVAIDSNSIIMLTLQSCSSCGTPYISATTTSSFTVSSTNILDASLVGWEIKQKISP